MGLYKSYSEAVSGGSIQRKASTQVITTQTIELPTYGSAEIRSDIAAATGVDGVSGVQISAVFACARVIAEGLATVPCILQRCSDANGHENAIGNPLFNLLARSPNSFQTSFEFREWLGFQLALLGNAFVWVSRNTKGQAIELIPLAPGSVTILPSGFGEVAYRLNVKGNPAYTKKNIWHVKGPSISAVEGVNPQVIAARAISLAAQQEEFGANLFKNGSRPSGLLTTDADLKKEQQEQLQAAWNAAQAGVNNAHKTAVLTNGLKFQPLQTTADDAQFIESRRLQIEEICRVYRVDPLMIQQAMNTASYASVEQRFLAHLQNCLGPWFERFSQSVEVNLLAAGERETHRVHLDARAMLRTNALDQAKYVQIMAQTGIMTRNELREMIGLDRSSEEIADQLTPAANLFGQTAQPSAQTDTSSS